MVSQQKMEEILEAIWVAEEDGEFTAEDIRRHCPEDVRDDDLTVMEQEGLVTLDGPRVLFTVGGRGLARVVVRRHRLTESLLVFVLKLPIDEAHEIACRMEHILPPEMVMSTCTVLGHPTHSPEGKPIPRGQDCVERRHAVEVQVVNLCELKPGEQGRITYIKPKSHGRLHRLSSFGIVPGVVVELHQSSPAYCIKFEETELALDSDIAEDIYVCKLNGNEG